MIAEAVLYLAGPADASLARGSVAGRPLAFRALMAAVRAGCRRVHVPLALRTPELERAIQGTRSARTAVAWLAPVTPPPAGPVLLVPAAALVTAPALAPIGRAEPPARLGASRDTDAPVLALPAEEVRALWPELAAGRPLGPVLAARIGEAPLDAAGDGLYARPGEAGDLAALERRLYATLGSAVDTRLDRALHRRLSRPITRAAVRLGIAPNAVTIASLLLGLGAVACIWKGTVPWALAGLAAYVASVALDHADGEVARLTFAESRVGEWLDIAADTVVHGSLVLAMGLAAQREVGGIAAALGIVAALGVVGSAAMFKTAPPQGGRGLKGLLDAMSNRDGFYAMLLAFILALGAWPAVLPLLMLVVAAGSHAFWLARLTLGAARA